LPTGCQQFIGLKKYYSTGSVQEHKVVSEGEFTFQNRPSRANRIAKLGDVLQARMKNTNKALLIDENLDGQLFSTGFLQLRAYETVYSNKLLYYYVNSEYFLQQRNNLSSGSTQEALTDNKAKEILIPIPPLPEQHRIVAKLDALFERIEANKRRLEKIPQILKRFRQSVLAAAVSGRLTEDWREMNQVRDNAEELYNKIVRDRRISYEREIKDAKEKKLRKPYLPTCFENVVSAWEDEIEIPYNWKILPLGNACEKITDGTHDTPKPVEKGIKYITAQHIRDRKIDFESSFYLQKEEHNIIYSRCNPKFGDVVIVNIGAGTATPALVSVDFEFSMKNVALAKPLTGLLLGQYLEFYLLFLKSKIINNITLGGAQPFLSLRLIKTIPLILPHIQEQKIIVQRLDKLFKYADDIETHFAKAKNLLSKFPQSLLTKAFCGELVPQDPKDEPASVLLERIMKEKGKSKKH
jgi:type I restriction enzyme S subunit